MKKSLTACIGAGAHVLAIGPLPLAAAIGVSLLFASSEVRRFERSAAADLSSKLRGTARRVVVRTTPRGLVGYLSGDLSSATVTARDFETEELPIHAEAGGSKAGRLGTLNLKLKDFVLAGLKVDRLEASIPDCRYDFGLAKRDHRIVLTKSGIGTGKVTLSQDALGAFILYKFHEIKSVTVHLADELIAIDGHGEFLLFSTDFKITGRLEVIGGHALQLVDAMMTFDDRSVDDASRETLLRALNPVVDLNKDLHLERAFELEGLRLDHGSLEAWGKATVPPRREN